MRSVNKVILIGNLTRDPELKSTSGGQSIVTLGLATNRNWTTSGSERRQSVEFHECVAWARLAEICQQNLRKGMLVYVEGYLKTRSWDMEDGTRRFRTEIVMQDMIILEKRNGGGEDYMEGENLGDGMHGEAMNGEMMSSADETMPQGETQPQAVSADIDEDNLF